MNVFGTSTLLLAAILFCTCSLESECYQLNYSEIQKLNASCSPKDTCSETRDLDDPDNHNCDCSSMCLLYDTCCIDSPLLNLTNRYKNWGYASCLPAGPSGGSIFMIDRCPSLYDGPIETRHVCENAHQNWRDPISNVPVTNMAAKKTYASVFCAICNGEDSESLTMWQITVDCASLMGNTRLCSRKRNYVLNNMMFDENTKSWGLWSWDSETEWQFRPLAVDFKMPPSLIHSVQHCRPNLISNCDPSWTDERTKNLCEDYMAAVYFPKHSYRNIHCAICNNVRDLTELSCHDISSSPFRSMISMSFGVLLDIDLQDGDKVGAVDSSCGRDQIYDPFSKKCRSISCALPGYMLQDNKCVKSRS